MSRFDILRRTLAGPRDSLQYRVASALALFVAIVVSAVMAALFTINDHLKTELLNGIVGHEMTELVQDYPTEGAGAIPHSANLIGYVVGPHQHDRLPPPLRALGMHINGVTLDVGDRTYRVGTHPIGDKEAYVAYDITGIENRETLFKVVAITAALIVLALAIPLGSAIARISLKPINALADHVGQLHPDERSICLADRFEYYEVGVIARAFDRFMGRLDEFVERERSFTADASHELRTPLAVIQGAVEVLQQDPRLSKSGPITRIDRATHQMAELIEALLFLARDEEHEPDGASPLCAADEVVHELTEAYRALAPAKQIAIGSLEPLEVGAPRIALVIAFGNLMRNALRHGGDDIRVNLVDGVLTVSDDGGGMNETQIRHVFERGFRSGPGAGLGLGLYLVKRVADRYGWKIDLNSQPARGTEVALRLS